MKQVGLVKKGFKFFLLGAVTASGLVGCLRTRDEIEETRQEVSTLQRGKADQEARSQSLESELRQMNGRIEALEHQLGQSQESQKNEGQQSRQKLDDVIAQMKIFEESLARLEGRIQALETPVVENTKATAKADKGDKSKKPGIEEADALFDKKEWKKSIQAYQKYREAFPKSPKYAEATYKMGVAFQEIGMKSESKAFFEEVLEKFPKSPSARKATYRLNQTKK